MWVNQALRESAMRTVRRYGPVAVVALAGALASLAAASISWRSAAIVLVGIVATAAVVRRVAPKHAMEVLTPRLGQRSEGDITAQATLRRKAQFANTLMQTQLEASPLGILVVDDTGTITAHNRRFEEIANVPNVVLSNMDDAYTVRVFSEQTKHPDEFLARVRYLYAHPEVRADDEIEMADDRVLQRHSVTLMSDGRSFGRVWFFADITDLRNAERSASEERDVVTTLLDNLPGYFVLIDASGRLVRWNESLRLLNGLSDEQLLGADPFANVVGDGRAEIAAKVRETIETGSATMVFRINSRRGVRELRWQGRRIMVEGKPHVLAIGIDFTDVHAAETLRRESEKRFRDIFESATEGILIQAASDGSFVDVNPRVCEMFGYSREEFLALDPLLLSVASTAEVLSRRAALAAETLSGATEFEWLCRAKDGHEIWCAFSSRRIDNFAGRDVQLSMVRDISDRRAAFEAITYRDRILHALTLSTAELVKASSLSDSITALLKGVGVQLNVDRLLVVRTGGMEDHVVGATVLFEWQRDGVAHVDFPTLAAPYEHEELQRQLVAWWSPLLGGVPVRRYASSATGIVRDTLLRGSTVSNLLLPISIDGKIWGHFGVDDTRLVRDWTPTEMDALKTVCDIVGAMIERDRTASALLESEEQFRTVSDTVLDAIIMIGTDDKVRYWNRAAERIFGYSSAEAIGKPVHHWLAPPRFHADADRGMAGFVATSHGAVLGKTVEFAAIRKDGVEIAVEFSINSMSVGAARYAVGIARDVTARNAASAAIGRMAMHDLLTDLPNRRYFIDALDAAIVRSKRSGNTFAVLYLDLDRFKDVNDTLGHPVGDRLLQAVAERLLANVRVVDVVARFGGDEFAAIQADITEPADAATLAQKIVNVLAQPFTIDENEIRSEASIGIAVYGLDSPDAEALLAHADVALYRAKADGRGSYRFYTESMDAAVRRRVTLEREVRDALTLGQFFLVYQPQVGLADGRIVGVEALVRWQHPTRGVVLPASFVAAAEASGLIVPLGAWVFREACRQTRCWIDAGVAPPVVGVNLSALQFRIPRELEASIVSTVRSFGLAASQIELELTESVMMQATQQHGELLVKLRAIGFRIAIDDFGNGYSSLDYLRRFHVDRIKIPQNFIQDLGLVSESAPIVRATISLAHELGITVIAEGVETAAQLAFLRSWGCREVQGYYFSEPLSAADAERVLRVGSLQPGQREATAAV
jgi:diguanylate cyclase (GGDEF)-like protein/PAS domain S-box-containing protein